MAKVREALTPTAPGAQDLEALSDTFIAGVVDGAFSKGIEMRNISRIDGPYRHGDRFRLRVAERGGVRRYLAYPTEGEATKAKRTLLREQERQQGWSVTEAIEEYEKHLRLNGNKETGIVTTLRRLRLFFAPMLAEKVAQLTSERAARLLDILGKRPSRQGETLSVDTRKNVLAEARTFAKWLAEAGRLEAGVFEGLRVPGRRRRGKPQLRFEEREKWVSAALSMAKAGDQGALAVLVALDGDLRSSEVWSRVVRDVDRGGRVLWVEDAKTQAGNRTVDLSPAVAEVLARQVANRSPSARVFPEAAELGDPKGWMLRACKRVCRQAGVPRVTPHGLRGTGATNDLLQELVASVSRKLGHTGTEMALGHYLDKDVVAQVRRALVRATLWDSEKRSHGGPTDPEPAAA